jgi:hypothetical protein
MSREGMEALRARVNDDPQLAHRLHDIEPDRFCADVVGVAAELGFSVERADVEEALAEGRRVWSLRWIR